MVAQPAPPVGSFRATLIPIRRSGAEGNRTARTTCTQKRGQGPAHAGGCGESGELVTVRAAERSREGKGPRVSGPGGPRSSPLGRPGKRPQGSPEPSDRGGGPSGGAARGPGKEQPRQSGGQQTPGWGTARVGACGPSGNPEAGDGAFREGSESGDGARPRDAGAGDTVDRGAGAGASLWLQGTAGGPRPGALAVTTALARPILTSAPQTSRLPAGRTSPTHRTDRYRPEVTPSPRVLAGDTLGPLWETDSLSQ
ncbi:spidroin-2-like [Lutra lutra]|uniref:spidroin-2-like n=1 Tax=Lutra lutra TaxID=9657 RepID=UPI001FCFFAD9|nr:spidroin-2-like [Lutra lutra]